ncbi:MAG TPA: glycoside hydrolase [Acidobacterium sp.]|uniref:Glycoside hydrolase n=2 Tax=Acidobacteriaceae TaxID=204434 RepID=C1F149_ACIC5|nr:conserved hypothetical protein [Acidobacterium capsulatum ATCC 51196]HCT61917.1 glycoside hydrolase [Acidobacterium sp.]
MLVGGLATAATAQTNLQQLEKTFQNPPDNAKPMLRWWWFGPSVTKPEILREMQQIKAGGFGGFVIHYVYPLALDDPQTGFRNLPFLSPAMLSDVSYANRQAHALGLRAGTALASGWPYGGPMTAVTEAAAKIVQKESTVAPGAHSVALPSIGNGQKLLAVFAQDGSAGSQQKMLPLPAPVTLRMAIPTGTHIVDWYLMSRTGQQVKRAAVDANGFVLDHFSHHAVADHLKNVGDKLVAAFGSEPPDSVFSDSLEVFGADWTPDFLEEFRKKNGYSLLPYLPDLFMKHPDAQALAVRHDWGVTLTALIDENYLTQVNAWARAHHTHLRAQVYGPPAVSLSSNNLVDLPEGEGPQWRQFAYTRWATSAGHLYGRPIISSETFTWLHSPAFRATPLDVKAEADRFFLQGVNQIYCHGWPYSPPSAGEPGWRFYAAAVFDAHNPWWIVMPEVTQYLQRVSWIMRQGAPANRVAIFLPEDDAWAAFTPGQVALTGLLPRWITPQLTQAIENSGYDFDYIDAAAIQARGIHYSLLILPNVDRISPAALTAIQQYEKSGGKVIALGRIPAHAPGFLHYEQISAEVNRESHAFFGHPGARVRVVQAVSGLGDALHQMLTPAMTLSAAKPAVGFVRRKLDDADIYFLANTSNVSIHTVAHLRSRYTSGTWLDPMSGKAYAAQSRNGGWPLHLAPYGSTILVLHAKNVRLPVAAGHDSFNPSSTKAIADLSSDWNVSFPALHLQEPMATLASWTKNEKTLYYSGVAVYRRTLEVAQNDLDHAPLLLSFGQGTPVSPSAFHRQMGTRAWLNPPVHVAAVVYVNGRLAGTVWHPPYVLAVGGLLKPGANQIEVRVANTAINEMAGKSLPDYRLLWARYGRRFEPQDMKHLQPLPSGLLGKVELLEGESR